MTSGDPAAYLVYATCPDAAGAERIGRQLVEEGCCACVNIIPGMRSVYRWQGRIETADEAVLIVKASPDGLERASRRLRELHPYAEPCVLHLPVDGGSATYLAWLAGGG